MLYSLSLNKPKINMSDLSSCGADYEEYVLGFNNMQFGGISFLYASADFLLGLFFEPEDGGNMFLQNMKLSLNNTALQPGRLCSL
jgi:hypothetical protein